MSISPPVPAAITVPPQLSRVAAIVAIALAIALASACSAGGSSRGPDVFVSSAGRSLAIAAPPSFTEAPTISLALDRIDQRDLPLDRIYRHYGTGREVTVYVFDGGVSDTHPELAGRVRRGFDAFPDEQRLCNGHGTAVAGAVAGATLGVASDAQIVDVKMVECKRMRGSIDAIVRGSDWVLQDHARHPGRRAVANWSFIADTSAAVPALDSAVQRLRAAGIPVVVSAGNVELDACHISPGNAPGVIVVGASRVRHVEGSAGGLVDVRAANTAFGPCIDIFAPGDSVMLPGVDGAGEPVTQLWTGTSMSAGYVSGAAALFLEANPGATVDAVAAHLRPAGLRVSVDPASPRAGILYVGTTRTPARTRASQTR